VERENSGFDGLPSLVHSKDWADYVSMLRDLQFSMQKQVNSFVRQQDLFKAFGCLSKLDMIEKQIELVGKKLSEIESKKK
jgi:hypothetical protein